MKMRMLLVSWMLAALASGQDDALSPMSKDFLEGKASLDELVFGEGMRSGPLTAKLGETVIEHDGETYDGLFFRMPEKSVGLDFVWYFNAPQGWANWYILPLGEGEKEGFRNWLAAEVAYEKLDIAGESKRVRALQTLQSDYFKPGKEYALWFKRVDDAEPGVIRLTAALAKPGEDGEWEAADIEKALGLERLPTEGQLAYLGSLGGKILFDGAFFERKYAESQADSLFISMRGQKRMEGGFFMQLKISAPPCSTKPKLADIIAKYGEPDFVRSSEEEALLADGEDDGEESAPVVKYYYDYFGFVVDEGDKDQIVRSVEAQANNYASLRPEGEERATFGRLSLENLMVFHLDGVEVGRIYRFDEGAKEPILIKSPPVGKYRDGGVSVDFRGDGAWTMEGHTPDGGKIYTKHYRRNMLDGITEVFHPGGKLKYSLPYRKGLAHGKLTEFDRQGEVVRELVYEDGELVE